MASVLAIVSKAVFEKQAGKAAKVGELFATDRYLSSHAAFEQLAAGDTIFLVTVRPPKEALWLVAIVAQPKRKKDGWYGAGNTTPIADITRAIGKLRFASGQGLKVKPGALGMSLQTPRVLSDDDVALLRGFTGSPAVVEYRAQVDATPAATKA